MKIYILKKVTFCFLITISMFCYANEINNKQQLIEKNLLLQTMELNNSNITRKSTSKICLTAPLPTIPKTQNYAINYTAYNKTIKLIFWREPCQDNTGSALLVRAIPIQGNPFLCGPNFSVIQNGLQLNDIKIQSTPDGSSWCTNLFIDTTFIINQWEIGEIQFNPSDPLTIIFEDQQQTIPTGILQKSNITGSVNGYKNYTYTCKNTKTGIIKSFPSQTGTGWNCNNLIIKPGDTVQTIINGIAK